MSTEQMRAFIAAAYPGQKWATRVKNMSEGQVFATYQRLKEKKK